MRRKEGVGEEEMRWVMLAGENNGANESRVYKLQSLHVVHCPW